MRAFSFKALARDVVKEGTIHAPSLSSARNSLDQRFDRVVSIEPKAREKTTRIRYVPALFTRQFSALIYAGIMIPRAIELLANQVDNADLQVALDDIQVRICRGTALSRALESHPRYFSPLYVSMCRVGEVRGDLPKVLLGLAEHQEMEEVMKKRVMQAMTYPAVVLGITAVLTFFLFDFVLPYFVEIFDSMHVPLPIYSQCLVLLVRVANSPILAATVALIVGGIVYLIRCWLDTADGRYARDEALLATPILGSLARKIILARFAKTLALLLDGGIYTDVALDLSSYVVQNTLYERALTRAQVFIREGRGQLSSFMMTCPKLFPASFVEFLMAGEEAGHVPGMLSQVAKLYDLDVEHTTRSVMSTIEPAMVALTGTVVGFIVVSIFMPLYSYMGSLS